MSQWYINVTSVVKGDKTLDDLNHRLWENNIEMTRDFFKSMDEIPPCGSVACLAGNVCIITGAVKPQVAGTVNGVELLVYEEPAQGWGLTARILLDLESDQASRLFFLDDSFPR